MSFKIAGLKILQNCAPYIRKRLKEDEVYLLSSEYQVDESNELLLFIERVHLDNSCTRHLYDINSEHGSNIEVTINAIVGKNGDGKSSLIEVILRILNNFAFVYGFLDDQPSLKYVNGVAAILYYEVDKSIYAIKCVGDDVSWYREGDAIVMPQISSDKEKKKYLKENHVEDLFYTMVINYSLYAYTPTSLGGAKNEEEYWIDGLFHKNDSYQTPVVLNPMRTKGNIDIIKEEYLSKQRLMSIFVKGKENDKTRMVSSDEAAVGYAFSLENESKFLKKSLRDFYIEHWQDELVWKDFYLPDNKDGLANENVVGAFHLFWSGFRSELAKNPELVRLCSKVLNERSRGRKSDLRRYLTQINDTAYPVNKITGRRSRYPFGREFGLLVTSSGELSKLNYRQFYRILLILLIWRCLTETDQCAMNGVLLNDVLKDTSNPRNAAMLYVLYKFISIVETYNGFCNGYYLTDDTYITLQREWPNRDALGTIKKDLELILKTDDYRTLKIKQAINYLMQNKDYYGADLCKFPDIEYDYYLSFEQLNKKLKGLSLKKIQWHLPCPVFEGDIILYDEKDYFPMGTLSSGMIQRLNSVGSLIYHLRNLDDEQKGKTLLEYANVTVVLEEVELYYHPEYQKSYLNYLLEQIERAELSRLKRLNLIFVTHSPFILSDVVRSEILCLENGKQATVKLRSFGANIHDMLRHPFFMRNGTIGDFAQKIINRIIVCLAIHDAIRRNSNKPFNWKEFKLANKDLAEYMEFIPLKGDGSLDLVFFVRQYSFDWLYEVILLIDEPIIKDALKRELFRIFSYVAP
jgi:hypothetical protein